MLLKYKKKTRNFVLESKFYSKYKHASIVRLSKFDNIYHCCTQRTASIWFTKVFNDIILFKYSGLDLFPMKDFFTFLNHPQNKNLYVNPGYRTKLLYRGDANFGYPDVTPLPEKAIGSPLYLSYPMYKRIPKPPNYRTFFILRDPRDIVVSWYFSTKISHQLTPSVAHYRNNLEKLDMPDGLKYSIDILTKEGQFYAQESWKHIKNDKNIRIFYYEDFAIDNFSFLKELLVYLDINIPDRELSRLFRKHKFEKYAKGRQLGTENKTSHYRKGQPGDWNRYFDSSITEYFRQKTGNLLETLNYFV